MLVGTIVKLIQAIRTYAGTLSFSGAYSKLSELSRTYLGTLSFAGVYSRIVGKAKTYAGTLSMSGTQIGLKFLEFTNSKAGTLSAVASIREWVKKRIRGQTFDGYSEFNYDFAYPISGSPVQYSAGGQAFRPKGDWRVTSAQFYLAKVGSPTGNAWLSIYTGSGTFGSNVLPVSNLGNSSNFAVSGLTTSYALTTFTFPTPIKLSAGQDYVLLLVFSLGSGTNYVSMAADGYEPAHEGNMVLWNNSTAQWVASTADASFYIMGYPYMSGVLSTSGIFSRIFGKQKSLTSALSFVGAIFGSFGKQYANSKDGALSFIGSYLSSFSRSRSFEGSIPLIGTLSRIFNIPRVYSGVLSLSGALSNLFVGPGVYSGLLSISGAISRVRETVGAYAGSLSFSGTFSKYIDMTRQYIGTISSSGVLQTFLYLGRTLSKSVSFAADIYGGVTKKRTGDLIDCYSEFNYDSQYQIAGPAGLYGGAGQSFTVSGNWLLTSAKFLLEKHGDPTGTCYAKIYGAVTEDTGLYIPNGIPVEISTGIDVSILPGTPTLTTFTFGGVTKLYPGPTYCITFEFALGDLGNNVLVGYDSSVPTHAGNAAVLFENVTETWIAAPTDVCFYTHGSPSASGVLSSSGIFSRLVEQGRSYASLLNFAGDVIHEVLGILTWTGKGTLSFLGSYSSWLCRERNYYGSLSLSGIYRRVVGSPKSYAGSLASAGAAARNLLLQRLPAGVVSFAGTALSQPGLFFSKSYDGVLSCAGAITKVIGFVKTYIGTLPLSGNLIRHIAVSKIYAGTLTFLGEVKQGIQGTAYSLSGTLSFIGSLTSGRGNYASSSLTFSGAASYERVIEILYLGIKNP